jgi:hypothetical protein
MWYEGYLKLKYRCLSDDMHTKLAPKKNPYEEITHVYEKDSCDSYVSDP